MSERPSNTQRQDKTSQSLSRQREERRGQAHDRDDSSPAASPVGQEHGSRHERDESEALDPDSGEGATQPIRLSSADEESTSAQPSPSDVDLDQDVDAIFGTLEADALMHQPYDKFLADFDSLAHAHTAALGSMATEILRQEEDDFVEQQHKATMEEHKKLVDAQRAFKSQVDVSRREFEKEILRARRQLASEAQHLRQLGETKRSQIRKTFRQAEDALLASLERRKAELQTFYGQLIVRDGCFSNLQSRRWRIDFAHAPQPVRLTLFSLRGIRNRLPEASYVMTVSLHTHLGGHAMRWSKLKGQEWAGSTLPFRHAGRHTDMECATNQSVFTVCPATGDISPSLVFIFELFLLRGALSRTDKPVAWTAFPVVGPDLRVLDGHFRAPLMRGPVDPTVQTHSGFLSRISNDLDSWLGNIYFHVKPLSRYLAGQREDEVELTFSSTVLGFPNRDNVAATEASLALLRPSKTETLPLNQPADEQNKTRQQNGDAVQWHQGASDGLRFRIVNGGPFSGEEGETQQQQTSSEVTIEPIVSRKQSLDLSGPTCTDPSRHKFSVATNELVGKDGYSSSSLAPTSMTDTKLRVATQQLWAEYSPQQAGPTGVWVAVLCLVAVFWLRMYTHYLFQWILLQAMRVPVPTFILKAFTVDLNYQATLLYAREELGVVAVGPASLIVISWLLMLVIWGCQRFLGGFIGVGYRFSLAWIVLTVLDPLLILLVDLCYLRWEFRDDQVPMGDAFKLYWHMQRSEQNGEAGALLTVFIYMVDMFVGCVTLYFYLLLLHNHGRGMDVFLRLNLSEDSFSMPHDSEVSIKELEFVVRKAEQWRGLQGQRRKVAVFDYIWQEEADEEGEDDDAVSLAEGEDVPSSSNGQGKNSPKQRRDSNVSFQSHTSQASATAHLQDKNDGLKLSPAAEITTHVSIHTIHLNGTRDLYRQFLRLPDGAILELFDLMGETLSLNLKQQLTKANVDITKLAAMTAEQLNVALQAQGNPTTATSMQASRMSRGRAGSHWSGTSFFRDFSTLGQDPPQPPVSPLLEQQQDPLSPQGARPRPQLVGSDAPLSPRSARRERRQMLLLPVDEQDEHESTEREATA